MATDQIRSMRAAHIDFKVNMSGLEIEATQSEKLPGVTKSGDMTWAAHFWGNPGGKWTTALASFLTS